MPRNIFGSQEMKSINIGNVEYDYQYPNGLNLRPDSNFHGRLLKYVTDRAQVGHETVSSRYDSWQEVDKTLCAYIPLDDAERLIKNKDERKPVSVVFPYSYAVLETLLSFMDSTFLRNPIFKYEGNTPEDAYGAAMLEKVIDIHCKRSKALLSLHTAFRDGLAYGVGAVFPMWKQQWGFRSQTMPGMNGESISVREPRLLFEGNAIDNVDPYKLLLDPNFGVNSIQSSEFVGFIRTTNYYDLLEAESTSPSMFNVKYLNHLTDLRTTLTNRGDNFSDRIGSRNEVGDSTRPVDLTYLYAKIIPSELGLGPSEIPEKWMFCIAGDRIVIQAQPLGTDHNMFPIAVCAPTSDGYSVAPLSRIEIISGLQGVVNFLFNSHIANVRKAVNDMIVVDPYAININDLKDPAPGKIIRARRAIWGKDLRGSIQQLGISDVTRAHVQDTQIITQQMAMLAGADDAMMGMLRQGGPERLTSQEFTGTKQAALGRLESMARIVGSQMLHDLAYMLAMHTQQLMTDEMWVTTSGRYSEILQEKFANSITAGKMKVNPQDIQIDFDINPADYGASADRDAGTWVQLFQTIASQPELNMTFDVPKIFKHIAQLLGAQNVDDFVRTQLAQPNPASIMPNEQVAQQAQAGNVVPIQEVANALRQ